MKEVWIAFGLTAFAGMATGIGTTATSSLAEPVGSFAVSSDVNVT